jgi:hypothetical protein
MIEFDISNDGQIGKIMQEFRPFIEKGGIVFVSFDDAILSAFKAIA